MFPFFVFVFFFKRKKPKRIDPDIVVLCFHPRIPVSSLVDSWPSLLALLKDSVPLGLPAPGQFLILGLVLAPAFIVTLTAFNSHCYSNWRTFTHSMGDGESVCGKFFCHIIFSLALNTFPSLIQSSEWVHFKESQFGEQEGPAGTAGDWLVCELDTVKVFHTTAVPHFPQCHLLTSYGRPFLMFDQNFYWVFLVFFWSGRHT